MSDTIRDFFEKMSDGDLLGTLSFFQIEFTPETLTILKNMAEARGITDSAVRQHRESCYPELELEFKCGSCECELLLDRDAFIDGEYQCPDCGCTNQLCYTDLVLAKSDLEDILKIAAIASVSIGGGVLLRIADNRKRIDRRDGILDGSYWKGLQEIARARSEGAKRKSL